MANIPFKSITFPGLPNKYTVPEISNDLMTAGKAADAKATGDALSALEDQFGEETDKLKADLDAQVADLEQSSKSVFCVVAEPNVFVPFIVANGDSLTARTASGAPFGGTTNIGFYNADKTAIANYSVATAHGHERTFEVALNEKAFYIKVFSVTDFTGETLQITNNSNLTYTKIKSISQDIENTVDYALYSTIDQSNNYTNGKYIALNGGVGNVVDITPVSSVQRGYVVLPCKKGDTFILTATGASAPRAWGFTDTQYKLLSVANTGASPSNLSLTAKSDGYFISNHDVTKTYALSATQLFKALSETEITKLIDNMDAPVVVDASGNGDYTSFTLACKETYDSGKDIVVKAGTYDIVSEYVAIWGQSAVDSMADADSATFDGWQYGVKMNGRKFTFLPGAKLVLDWTDHTVNGTHRFSALRVERNVEIIGLDLDCTATFYAIHDDYGNDSGPYTVTYRNCRVIGHNLTNANCIGGGCKKWSRHIIDNCYFDNGLIGSATVRYHNTNAEGAEPEIYVSNTYFNNWFTPRWYGTQTSKMRVYVNNCEARAIYKMAESSSYNVDNVELYKWCNIETSPQN